MSKIIKSIRKIIKSMREDLKSVRKVFQVNARSFSSQCALLTRENLKSTCKVIAQSLKLQLHDAIYRLRFYSNSLIHILSLSNLHNNVASLQKNWDNKSHRVIVAQVKCQNEFLGSS